MAELSLILLEYPGDKPQTLRVPSGHISRNCCELSISSSAGHEPDGGFEPPAIPHYKWGAVDHCANRANVSEWRPGRFACPHQRTWHGLLHFDRNPLRNLSRQTDLNRWPYPYQGYALPTELWRHVIRSPGPYNQDFLWAVTFGPDFSSPYIVGDTFRAWPPVRAERIIIWYDALFCIRLENYFCFLNFHTSVS